MNLYAILVAEIVFVAVARGIGVHSTIMWGAWPLARSLGGSFNSLLVFTVVWMFTFVGFSWLYITGIWQAAALEDVFAKREWSQITEAAEQYLKADC